jgi:radical SAM superfamily enzyme YgiQ (UPF0313 family)
VLRIAFVYPPHRNPRYAVYPPLGLLAAATVARDAGHRPGVVDGVLGLRLGKLPLGEAIYERLAELSCAMDPDVVAFSTQSCTVPATVAIARRLRARRFDGPLIVGGYGARHVGRALLDMLPGDCVVVEGDAETVLPEMLYAIEHGKRDRCLPGIVSRRCPSPESAPPLDLDAAPFPDYALLNLREYAEANRLGVSELQLMLDVGRGCTYRCTFCSYAEMRHRQHYVRPVHAIMAQLRCLTSTYGVRRFGFTHDCFTLDREWAAALCSELEGQGIEWTCKTRTDCVDKALLDALARAGCSSVLFGIEASAPKTLRVLGKASTTAGATADAVASVEGASARNIWPVCTFLLGAPSEPAASIDATIAMALDLAVSTGALCSFHTPVAYAGTALWRQTHEYRTAEVVPPLSRGTEFGERSTLLPADEALILRHPAVCSSFYAIRNDAVDARTLAALAVGLRDVMSFLPLTMDAYRRAGGGPIRELILSGPHDIARLLGDIPDACSMDPVPPPTHVVRWLMTCAHRAVARCRDQGVAELAAVELAKLMLRSGRGKRVPRGVLLGPLSTIQSRLADHWTSPASSARSYQYLLVHRTDHGPQFFGLPERLGQELARVSKPCRRILGGTGAWTLSSAALDVLRTCLSIARRRSAALKPDLRSQPDASCAKEAQNRGPQPMPRAPSAIAESPRV